MGSTLRYVGGAVGFGFGAVWMTVGIGSAIACLLLAALGYGAVFVAERAQANASTDQTPEVEADLSILVDELELDDERDYDPLDDERDYEPLEDATSPLAAEADYGWPLGNGAVEKPTVR